MTTELKSIAKSVGMRYGEGTRTQMRAFFDEGDGFFVVTENVAVIGTKSYDIHLKGANSAKAVRLLEGEIGRKYRVRASRTGTGYIVTVYITAKMRFGKAARPTPTPPTPSGSYLYFEAKQANSTVSMMSMLATAPNIEYSTDGSTFQEWQHTTSEGTHTFDTITLGAVGDKVYLRGTNAALADLQTQQMSVFMPTGDVKVGGSVQSLVDGTGESTTAIMMAGLFASGAVGGSATALTEVEIGLLPATTLADYCYNSMFINCTALTSAPALPATTLAESCYVSMFNGCTSLTTAPTLPATTLADDCYDGMFNGCTSLTTAPTLPATTLTERCYDHMFYGCTSLNSVTCLATDISALYCLDVWLDGVAASGTLYKAPAMTGWVEGTNYPNGWTLADYSA